jgi:CheY-like chemotaxis protein
MAAEWRWDGATRSPGAASSIRRDELDGVRVLIVDDNAAARDSLRRWFEYIGAAAVTAASADEALLLFALVPPHIVLTDVTMPHHDGYSLLRELRALERRRSRQRTPVIAMTAFRFADAALHSGFDDWVSKPVDLADVSALVGRITRMRRAA